MMHTIIDPNGNVHRVSNIRQFCLQHGLSSGNLNKVVWGSRKHHRGYTCPDAGYVRMYRGEVVSKYLRERPRHV